MARSRKKKKRAGEVRISTATPNAMAPAKAGSAVRSAGTALRWILGLAIVSGVALVLWWGGGSDGPAPEAPAPTAVQAPSQSAGHLRMLTELAAIRDRTADVNQWQGDAKARQARSRLSRLPAEGLELERFQLLTDVGEHELRLGNETDAIDRFATAVELLPTLEGTLSETQALRTVFRLGVAYLRYGETQNCTQRHNADSCILPIRGDGVHTDETGSRAAIDAFLHVLEGTQRTDPLHIKSVWLLNLAYMTVGGYPDEVPPDYRLAPDVFESEESFPRFVNVAARLGLADFTLSGGTVFDDFDGDDDLDLVTTTFDAFGEPRFYRNRGDGNFDDRSGAANLKGLYGGLNLVQADYDNDGDLDIYVLRGAWLASAGRQPNSLWRNDGTGRFADVTFEAGLGETALPAQSAAWADYDNDGDVDLFVGNEHGTPPAGMGLDEEPFDAPSELFRNNGDGTFTDVAAEAGVRVLAFVKGTIWGDYDNDRHPDLYVSVLGGTNHLFHNDGDGTFTDVATDLGVDGPQSSFPVWFFDYDNDGALDLFVPSYRGSRDGVALVAASAFGLEVPYEMPSLYRGNGDGRFTETAKQAGLDRLVLPMGSNFGDLDNDGYLDFYLGTGYPDYEGLMPNVLYRNVEGRRFADITVAAGLGHLQKGHAVSFADYDGDGDTDLFAQMGGAFPGDKFSDALFQNPGFDHRWIGLHLVGDRSNRAAIGARIRVDIREGETRRSIYRHVNSGGSFGCNPLRQTIGIGKATEIERVEIYWPASDLVQTFESVRLDTFYRLTEGAELARI